MNRFFLIIILGIAFFAGYFFGEQYPFELKQAVVSSQPLVVDPASSVSAPVSSGAYKSALASIMIDYGDGRIKVYDKLSIVENETVLSLLEKTAKADTLNITTKSFSGLGLLIESIGDRVNGDGGKYWQYWVNNSAAPVAAGEYKVKAGDIIEWKFINYKRA